jgi:hypothetical protein
MHPQWKLLTALAATAFLLPPSSARADADACGSDPAPAKCYLLAAQNLKDTKPGEAAVLYLKSYRLDPKIDPLAGYGFALAQDKQYVAAAEALQKAVEEYEKLRGQMEASNTDANTLFQVIHRVEFVKGEIAKLVPNLGQVQLKVTDKHLPPGVTVMRKGGTDLRGSDMTVLFVNKNTDVLVFTYPSGRTGELEVHVPVGTISTVEVPAEPPLPQAPPPPPPPPKDEAAELRRWAYISGGVGCAFVAGGFGYVLAVNGASGPVTGTLIGVGVVGIGVGVLLYVQAQKKEAAQHRAEPSTAFAPVIDQHAIGAVFAGTF